MNDRKIKHVTLRDIANRLGVSAMTVSRALSGKEELLNSKTAIRCRELADELGYVPNLMARSLRGQQLKTIVMFAEDISSHHYLAQLVGIISQRIEAFDYSVISCQSLMSLRQAMANFKLAGAVIVAPPEEFYREPIGGLKGMLREWGPAVLIHSAVEQNFVHEVSPDIAGFTQHATSHLLELGHRHIAYLGGPFPEAEPKWFDMRRAGAERALRGYGVPVTNFRHQPCSNATMGPATVQQLLNSNPEITALICINDEIALSAIVGAKAAHREVPGDLSIVGCNNIKLGEFFTPPLTTFSIEVDTMVTSALNLLFADIKAGGEAMDVKPSRTLLPANLIVRGTTGPLKK